MFHFWFSFISGSQNSFRRTILKTKASSQGLAFGVSMLRPAFVISHFRLKLNFKRQGVFTWFLFWDNQL